jgi:hypothetical protein
MELNQRFPAMKGDLNRQEFGSGWYNARLAGRSDD